MKMHSPSLPLLFVVLCSTILVCKEASCINSVKFERFPEDDFKIRHRRGIIEDTVNFFQGIISSIGTALSKLPIIGGFFEQPTTEAPPTVEPRTQPPTKPPTQPPTKPPTQPPTLPPTKPPTQPPTEPPTQPPVEPETEEPDTDEPDTDEPDTDEPDTDEPYTDEPYTDDFETDEPIPAMSGWD